MYPLLSNGIRRALFEIHQTRTDVSAYCSCPVSSPAEIVAGTNAGHLSFADDRASVNVPPWLTTRTASWSTDGTEPRRRNGNAIANALGIGSPVSTPIAKFAANIEISR